jgi:acyl-CoA thioesterase
MMANSESEERQIALAIYTDISLVPSTALLCRIFTDYPKITSVSATHHTHHVRQSSTNKYAQTLTNPKPDS